MRCHSGNENIFIEKIPDSGCKNINISGAGWGMVAMPYGCHGWASQQGSHSHKMHTQTSISLFILRHTRQAKPTLTNDCSTSLISPTSVHSTSSPTVCVNLRLHIYSFSTLSVGEEGEVCCFTVYSRQCYCIYKWNVTQSATTTTIGGLKIFWFYIKGLVEDTITSMQPEKDVPLKHSILKVRLVCVCTSVCVGGARAVAVSQCVHEKCLNLFWVQIFCDCIALWLGCVVMCCVVGGERSYSWLYTAEQFDKQNHRGRSQNQDHQPMLIPYMLCYKRVVHFVLSGEQFSCDLTIYVLI